MSRTQHGRLGRIGGRTSFHVPGPIRIFLTINNTHTIINTPSGCIRDHKRVPSGYIKMASLFHSARMKLRRGQSMMAKFGGISVSDPDMFV